jgi:hypothetical protein
METTDMDGLREACNTCNQSLRGLVGEGGLMPYPRFLVRVAAFVGVLGAVFLGGLARNDSALAGGAGGMAAMSVDMDITGNQATALGSNNTCVQANAGDSVTFDVTALGIPVAAPITAFGFRLDYDGGNLVVTAENAQYLLAAAPNSSVADVSDLPPDSDGQFYAAALDTDTVAAESGSGVLMRLTVEVDAGAPDGLYALTLGEAAHIDPQNDVYPPNVINDGAIAVGQACPTAFGDVDCSTSIGSVDALKVLRFGAALSVSQTEPCVDLGVALPNGELQGDVDCSNAVNSVDALKLLRHSAALSVTQTEPCPDIGT